MTNNVCGVVLSGGESRRFGSDKALACHEGNPLILYVIQTLTKIFEKTFIVTRRPESFQFLKSPRVEILPDLLSHFHPLGGLHSAMTQADFPAYFVCACDAPKIEERLISLLCQSIGEYEAAVCRWAGEIQPLPGIYRRELKGLIQEIIKAPGLGLRDVLTCGKTRILSESQVQEADPAGLSFTDIDTPSELARLKARR